MNSDKFKQMLEANPYANRDKNVLKEALMAIEELRRTGIEPNGYNLAAPFERRRRHEKMRRVICKKA